MSAKAPISKEPEVIHSHLWQELEEPDNPFAAKACYCAGYEVYGDLLGKATWIEYLYLLFKHEGLVVRKQSFWKASPSRWPT